MATRTKSVSKPAKRKARKASTEWQTIGIYLPKDLGSRLRSTCRQRGVSRSALIASALGVYFAREDVSARVAARKVVPKKEAPKV